MWPGISPVLSVCALQRLAHNRPTFPGSSLPKEHLTGLSKGQGLFCPNPNLEKHAPTWDQGSAELVTVLQGAVTQSCSARSFIPSWTLLLTVPADGANS